MVKNLTPDERDQLDKMLIERNPAYIPVTLGPLAAQALFERDTRENQFNSNTSRYENNNPEDKNSPSNTALRYALIKSIVAAASDPFAQPGPYAVPTKTNPITVRGQNGQALYIDDGMSCKNPFNTAAATPVSGTQKTFKFEGPQKRDTMSFAEAASIPASTYYAQIGAQSAVPSSSALTTSFDRSSKTFAETRRSPDPIIAPGLMPEPFLNSRKWAPSQNRIVDYKGPPLDLNLN